MSEDFRVGCWEKIKRADEHIKNLNSEIDAFLSGEPKPYRVVRYTKEEGRAYEWIGFEEQAPPLRFAVIAGEIIHHLRSSLDHLVVGMVRRRENAISTRHAFPITKEPKKFKSACDDGVIQDISLRAQNLIESKQPYNTGNADSSVLWTLHSQDIEDKHRLLVVVTACAYVESLSVGPTTLAGNAKSISFIMGPHIGRPVRLTKEGVQIGMMTSQGASKFDPEAQFSPLIAFEEFGTVKLQPVVKGLTQVRDFVLQTIREFDGEFA
jgi:hypothetical protein